MVGTPSDTHSRDPSALPNLRTTQKTGAEAPVPCRLTGFLSELPVRSRGSLVDRVLGGFLGVAEGLLALALDFLHGTFALQPVGTGSLADALLGLAHGFVGRAFNLVCRASHGTLLFEVKRRGTSPART